MALSTRDYFGGSSHGRNSLMPPGVKWLLISNIALFVVYFFSVQGGMGGFFQHFQLIPALVVGTLAIWQLFTYMFLHDPHGFGHILFNMLMLWMFGKDLENGWGTRRFLKFYFICGIGAGLCVVIGNYLFGNPNIRTIGASGAIYGLLLAFGMTYPNVTVYFSFLFPIKAKYFVMIMGAIAFLSSFGANTGVSNVAHLGGMLFGFLYLRSERASARLGQPRRSTSSSSDFIGNLRQRYKQWQVERARRKFQVYMRKHDRGPWVN
jgi:membrane associated rhomboid family serine protease